MTPATKARGGQAERQKGPSPEKLRSFLDRYYRDYDFSTAVMKDPISFPRRYRDPKDMETAGFLASSFAYGSIRVFPGTIETILGKMGTSPHDFLLNFSIRRHEKLFRGIRYRFNSEKDIVALLFVLQRVLQVHGSLEALFKAHFTSSDSSVKDGLSGLIAAILSVDTSAVYGDARRPPGFIQFFPSPASGSACKRANLFLRWMIRDRDIDLGIWKGIPANKLIIPLDIHIARISRCLGLTERKTQDWTMAEEITASLSRLDPNDPLKYDFALCHHGISGACRDLRKLSSCRTCVMRG